MRSRTVKTPYEGFRFIFNHLVNHHEDFISENGDVSWLGETLCVHILYPLNDHEKLIEVSCQGKQAFEYYREQLVDGEHIKKDNPEDEAEYTYYGRLNKYDHGQKDQINDVICKLQEHPNSRRAVASTWVPWIDPYNSEPPCMNWLKFSIKHEKLCLTVVFRSHDALKAWPQNVYAISYLMKFIADILKKDVGYLEVISCDPHIYIRSDQLLVDETKQIFKC